jgi:AcrR family transcriptional regulator
LAFKKLVDLKLKERDARRRLILHAARELFAKKDFRSVNVREIAKTAGVSIGTIYNYYANLTDLFLDVFLKSAEEIEQILNKENQSPSPSLSKFCELYIAYLNDNMTFYQMMGHFMLAGDLPPDATDKLNHVMRMLMDRIEERISAQGAGFPTRLYAHALFSALNGIMISYARYPGRTTRQIKRHTLRLAEIIALTFAAASKIKNTQSNISKSKKEVPS